MPAPSAEPLHPESDAPDPLGSRLWRALVAVLALATVTCWLQLFVVLIRREVFGVFSWKWWLRDQVFLSATGYLLLLPALALVPVAVHLAWPRRYSFAALAASLAGLGAFCVLLVFERISWLAWLVVAVGVGVQLYRALRRWPAGGWRWTWRIALAGHLASLLVVVATGWSRQTGESASLRALPPAPPDAPNVLLIVMDTERAKDLSLYGAALATTPNLVARAQQGVTFEGAFSTSSWTLPSHTSMFTGQYPSHTSADWLTPLDTRHPTLAEVFREHGVATGGFVANVNFTGYSTGLARGFIHYEDSKRSLQQVLLGTTLMQAGSVARAMDVWEQTRWITGTARAAVRPVMLRPRDGAPEAALTRGEQVTDNFLAWLPTLEGRPFFAFLNLFDAHGPYQPPAPYRTMFDSEANPHGRYRGAIRYVDDTIEALLQELDRQGILSRTIVVITSDHGELWGEHDRIGHGNGLYWPQLHVPLVVLNAPGAAAGLRVQQQVSLRDLPATLLDLAAIPNAGRLGGTSLRPLLAGVAPLPTASPILAELSPSFNIQALKVVTSPVKALIDDSSLVIVSADGAIELLASPAPGGEAAVPEASPDRRRSAGERLRVVMASLGITWRP